MKKLIASVLAVSMVASMAATAFAASTEYRYEDNQNLIEFNSSSNGTPKEIIYAVAGAEGPYAYDEDEKQLSTRRVTDFEYGDKVYYLLLGTPIKGIDGTTRTATLPGVNNPKNAFYNNALTNAQNYEKEFAYNGIHLAITQSDSVDNMRIREDWEMGSKWVDDVKIIRKKITNVSTRTKDVDNSTNFDTATNAYAFGYTTAPDMATNLTKVIMGGSTNSKLSNKVAENGYYYLLEISTKDSTSTNEVDVIGTITLDKSRNPSVKKKDLPEIQFTLGWNKTTNVTDTINSENYKLLDFGDEDGEIDLEFEDNSTFTVDVSGQRDTLVYYDTRYNSAVANKYPEAELDFWNGNGARFNRVGEFFLSFETDYNAYLYELRDDGTLSKMNCKYDEYDQGFYFNTRTIGSYVISDTQLNLTPVAPVTPVTPIVPTVPTNPETGCIA